MKMIDIGKKGISSREAIVEGKLRLKPVVVRAIKERKVPKGDVIEAAKLAGILAAKKTPEIIPLCHPIPLDYVNIECSLSKEELRIVTTVRGRSKTGVEMEAFTACAVASLTIYDMCKSLDREITISEIRLLKKTGGRSGTYISL